MSWQKLFPSVILAVLSVVNGFSLRAQVAVADSLVARGDMLREAYRFSESVSAYKSALDTLDIQRDSIFITEINDKVLLSENGISMMGFAYTPTVVAKHKFALDEFFLYYPLKDGSWRPVPNELDSLSGPYAKAIYAPEGNDVIYYSAQDQEGIRNIYRTSYADSLWTLPTLLNEQMTSASDEIYPMISPDGNHLYFASKGLYGVGGYDLYVSEWDEVASDWSVPVNMGFPYSSPANDFMLVTSDDGKYTLFASDRGCSADSVWVYVLEYDSMPVRSNIADPDELAELSILEPVGGLHKSEQPSAVKSDMPENANTRKYMDKMAKVRALKDTISFYESNLADYREKYSMTESESERARLAEKILKNESLLPEFQASLDEAVKLLQEVEMEFLFSGVVVDPDRLLMDADREFVSETPDYVFSKVSMGDPLDLKMEKPVPAFDYSFKILDVGQFAEDNTIPGGIVYQIQIFGVATRVSEKSLKGLSPVFEVKTAGGKYVYRVGVFRTYSDVLSNLNKVKKLGFRGAFIVGYVDGKEMQVNKVRTIESERKKMAPTLYKVLITKVGELDEVSMKAIRQQSFGKDIARMEGGFVIGPFDNKSEAESLMKFIEAMGYGQVEVVYIEDKIRN